MEYGNVDRLLSQIETLRAPDFYITPEFSEEIEPRITQEKLGAGAFASTVVAVQPLPGVTEELVVKITAPCLPPSGQKRGPEQEKLFARECRDIRNHQSIRRLPSGGGKDLLEIPNFLSEALIGAFMKRLQDVNLTPHLSPVYGIWEDPNRAVSYELMPRFKTDIADIVNDTVDVDLILFQVAQGLSVAQEQYRFTHYDLHIDNVLYKEENIDRAYPIVGETGTISWLGVYSRGYTVKIADYGLARMETQHVILDPRIDDIPIKTSGQFNPSYDIVAFIGSLLVYRDENPLYDKIKISDRYLSEIYGIIFDVDPAGVLFDISAFENSIYMPNWWRPKGQPEIEYIEIPSIHTIVRGLAQRLVRKKLAIVISGVPKSDDSFVPVSPLLSYRLLTPRPIRGPPELPVHHRSITIAPGVQFFTYLKRETDPELIKPTQWTRTLRAEEQCPISEEYIHIVFINTAKAHASGYRLRFECCKLDVLSYISQRFGVAINGGFFDLEAAGIGTDKPIGPYKTRRRGARTPDFITDVQIPSPYEDDYAVILLRDDQISISQQAPPGSLFGRQSDYLYSGPLLVANGNIVMTDEKIKHLEKLERGGRRFTVAPYQCRLPVSGTDKTIGAKYFAPPPIPIPQQRVDMGTHCTQVPVQVNYAIPSCQHIEPGELSHAGNPNPRSAIATRKNTDGNGDLMFIYVEGRDDRGTGMDLVQLAKLAKEYGAIDCVNLDGGRSSAIGWRSETDPDIVRTANPNHKNGYVVGNLIALVKQ